MIGILAGTLAAAFAALFDPETIPFEHPSARVFPAQGHRPEVADLFVLDGFMLRGYVAVPGWAPIEIALPEGTSAIDIADIDGDEQGELVAVQGERVIAFELFGENRSDEPTELFQLETQLSVPSAEPYLHVMAIPIEGTVFLGLPVEDRFEIRSLTGKLREAYPTGDDAPKRVAYGMPFSAWTVHPPEVGPPGALEAQVSRTLEFEPDLPPEILPPGREVPAYRRGTAAQIRDAAGRDYAYWPWFPLTTDGETSGRVLYAAAGPDYGNTLIRIWQSPTGAEDIDETSVTVRTAHRYPGTLIATHDGLPDFNGDGYVDLLLWQAPDPGISVDSLTRALTQNTWPVDVSTHLLSPERLRYEPKPAGHIALRIPIAWFLDMADETPLRHVTPRDFDGDGHTDLGFSTATNSFSVWLWGDKAFSSSPDYTHAFDEDIERVEFCADVTGTGRPTIVLRLTNAFCLLRPGWAGR